MAKVIKVFKVIRNNWKKSVFFSGVLVYGVNYGVKKYDTYQQMRHYCLEAVKIGDEIIKNNMQPRHITVILNPAANKRKAKTLFEKYCAPLLHLSGIRVDVLITESSGQARSLAENLNSQTDAVLVAGGDGTLSEVVTGLMRKNVGKCDLAIGVLPLGRTNSLALSLLGCDTTAAESVTTKHLAEATMAVIRGETKPVHSLKIEVLEDEIPKPVYGLSSIEWGAWRDAKSRRDKYWYYGPLRNYAAYFFNPPTLPYHGKLLFSSPCSGCSRCYASRPDLQTPNREARWWHVFIPKLGQNKSNEPKIDYMSIENNNCGSYTEREIHTLDLSVVTPNINPSSSAVDIIIGPENISWTEFVAEGWRRERGDKTVPLERIEAQHVEIKPKDSEKDCERWLSIDNEDYEVKPIKATLLYNSELKSHFETRLNISCSETFSHIGDEL
ncbi:acylglycerol kinase-like protein Mulk isoform X2 [Lycorma delicatula]|uniref:acylglycerol kinase-like protein Mulk isoform X2 n=1 Tax=Lycorma delicatula TaxID=130591 RepID=UPI003F51857F